jgi:carbon-monoxide dehydrogenase small subunit
MPNTPEQHTVTIACTINGRRLSLGVNPAWRLLDLLRDHLGLTGAKEGCGEGECGACTVRIDGLPANSCLVLAVQASGRSIETVESIDPASLGFLHASGATQCGACTPGVVITADWIRRNPDALEHASVRALMAGNLCRCTGYNGIIDGVMASMGFPGEAGACAGGDPCES